MFFSAQFAELGDDIGFGGQRRAANDVGDRRGSGLWRLTREPAST